MPASEPAVYVHVPFCRSACPYCNFNFRLRRHYDDDFLDAYVAAVLREWETARGRWSLGERLYSLYLGGGTPSLLSGAQVARLVSALAMGQTKDIEITLEANPEDVCSDPERLAAYRAAGVNRLSWGVQSFNERLLAGLGRGHRASDVGDAIRLARQAGFSNISCDLMGALPQQTLAELQSDLDALVGLPIQHVSHYSLTIEEKTLFHAQVRSGNLSLPAEDLAAQMMECMEDHLVQGGFEHYEISNYARAGFESQHNLAYWTFREYVGLGAGAHSFFRRCGTSHRAMNVRDPKAYVETIAACGVATESTEDLTGRKAMGEFIFTGLRKLRGLWLKDFSQHFDCTLDSVYEKELAFLMRQGLLRRDSHANGDCLALTRRGVHLSDSVFEQFV